MPWNFPFWQVFRFAAPAIMAGNVGLLKHAANVPQCALAIEDVFRRAGAARGVFQTLLIESDKVAAIIKDSRVQAVTLDWERSRGERSGGDRGARRLRSACSSSAGAIPSSSCRAPISETALTTAVKARTQNNGQSCIAAKRFLIAEEIYDEFVRQFVERMKALKVGDPLDEATEIGPLATPAIRDGVDQQVRKSIEAGAKLLLGGKPDEGAGNFYPPTVLAEIPKDSPAYREEIFGPVALLFSRKGRGRRNRAGE